MTASVVQRPGRRARAATGCERPGAGRRGAERSGSIEPTLFDDERVSAASGEPTLDELVSGLWQGLAAHQRVPCPLCGGEMAPVYGAHAQVAVGRCGDCGTTLG